MDAIDFLPDRIRAQRARRHRLAVQCYLLVICLAGLGALGYCLHVQIGRDQEELALLGGRSEAMKMQLDLRASLEQQLGDLMIKRRIEEQLGRRVSTLNVLGELQRVMPESMALTSLTMETVEVRMPVDPVSKENRTDRPVVQPQSPDEKTVKRVRLVITGMAPTDVDVANFIGQLASSPIFEDVNMGYAKNILFRSRSARKFQASCYVTR
jgi:Tfp pilus assembly protein PilN